MLFQEAPSANTTEQMDCSRRCSLRDPRRTRSIAAIARQSSRRTVLEYCSAFSGRVGYRMTRRSLESSVHVIFPDSSFAFRAAISFWLLSSILEAIAIAFVKQQQGDRVVVSLRGRSIERKRISKCNSQRRGKDETTLAITFLVQASGRRSVDSSAYIAK